jgi:apolipoprotein N-acyltransferase
LGFFQLHSHELAASSGIEHILIVNPEVGTDVTDKSKDASYSNYATSRLQQFIRPTEAYLDDKQNESPDLIVWGESAALHNVFQEQDGKVVYSENSDVKLLQDFIARNKKPVLLGAYIYRLDGGQTMFYNSAVLIDGNGRIQDYYNKNKLLFLGEYIPPYLKFLVPFADRLSLVRKLQSDKKTTFNNGGFSFVTPICYENGFNDFVRELILSGRMSDAIINMTDDADFADLRQAWQHMSVNVFRAIESGIPAIAAANFGVSGSVSSDGIITGPVLSGKGVLEVDIPLRGTGDLTFFLKHGNIFIGISFVYLCGLILFGPLILKKTKTKK